MANNFVSNSMLNDHLLRQVKIGFEFTITGNATPASKVHQSDLPGVVHLRTEGKTSVVDAIEDLSGSFTTADDESGGDCVFGVFLDLEDFMEIHKVNKIEIYEVSALSTSEALTLHGTNGLSSNGNIAFTVAGTGLRLDTESPTFYCEIDLLLKP